MMEMVVACGCGYSGRNVKAEKIEDFLNPHPPFSTAGFLQRWNFIGELFFRKSGF